MGVFLLYTDKIVQANRSQLFYVGLVLISLPILFFAYSYFFPVDEGGLFMFFGTLLFGFPSIIAGGIMLIASFIRQEKTTDTHTEQKSPLYRTVHHVLLSIIVLALAAPAVYVFYWFLSPLFGS